MKAFGFIVAVMAAACAGVLSSNAQDPRIFLRLTIVTGDDDLRGGNDNVMGSYRLGSTWSAPAMLNRRAMRWPDRSRNRVELDLPATPATLRNLNALRLQTTSGGGLGGDNWNLDQLYVQICLVPSPPESPCVDLGRFGPKRFTGSDRVLIAPVSLPRNDSIEK